MVEEVDNKNLYIAVSSPDLNFNINRTLEVGSQVNGHERFYSISMPVEIQVIFLGHANTLQRQTFECFFLDVCVSLGY